MLSLHAPTIDEFGVRQRWLADPEMMSYNAQWDLTYPGYDLVTGCIDWPESDWPAFQARLALSPEWQGYYYVLDTDTDQFIGHIHYLVDPNGTAEIGFNVIPERRGEGLGAQFLRLLLERVWLDTSARLIVQEFEDERVAAVEVHRQCGFTPEREARSRHGDRLTRTWRITRP
jgi:RimJ/RimL family protein N-acetyltransferase